MLLCAQLTVSDGHQVTHDIHQLVIIPIVYSPCQPDLCILNKRSQLFNTETEKDVINHLLIYCGGYFGEIDNKTILVSCRAMSE